MKIVKRFFFEKPRGAELIAGDQEILIIDTSSPHHSDVEGYNEFFARFSINAQKIKHGNENHYVALSSPALESIKNPLFVRVTKHNARNYNFMKTTEKEGIKFFPLNNDIGILLFKDDKKTFNFYFEGKNNMRFYLDDPREWIPFGEEVEIEEFKETQSNRGSLTSYTYSGYKIDLNDDYNNYLCIDLPTIESEYIFSSPYIGDFFSLFKHDKDLNLLYLKSSDSQKYYVTVPSGVKIKPDQETFEAEFIISEGENPLKGRYQKVEFEDKNGLSEINILTVFPGDNKEYGTIIKNGYWEITEGDFMPLFVDYNHKYEDSDSGDENRGFLIAGEKRIIFEGFKPSRSGDDDMQNFSYSPQRGILCKYSFLGNKKYSFGDGNFENFSVKNAEKSMTREASFTISNQYDFNSVIHNPEREDIIYLDYSKKHGYKIEDSDNKSYYLSLPDEDSILDNYEQKTVVVNYTDYEGNPRDRQLEVTFIEFGDKRKKRNIVIDLKVND